MRPFLLTSISGGGIVLISYIGMVLNMALARELPSILESARVTFFVTAVISFVVSCGEVLS